MNRKETIEQAAEYFRSPQWQDVLHTVQTRDMNHMHVYVDTSLDPATSLRPLVEGFFRNLGWDFYRPIDIMGDKPGKVALYGIHLEDKLNFEIYCRLTTDAVLAPMSPRLAERGGNVRVWSVDDIKRFQNQFAWRQLTDADRQMIANFFSQGSHWQKALDYVLESDVLHVHCNVETSVHPEIIRKYAVADLAKRGFRLKHTQHSVFNGGGYDCGKIVFIGSDPARTYDIAYYFNPGVLLEVNTQETHMVGGAGTGNEYYVVRVSTAQEEIAKHDLIKLTNQEIQQILDVVAGFQQRSTYSWRFVPAGKAS